MKRLDNRIRLVKTSTLYGHEHERNRIMSTRPKKVVSIMVTFFLLSLLIHTVFGDQIMIIEGMEGEPIIRHDFENFQPKEKILNDQAKEGYWNIREKTWVGANKMLDKILNPVGRAPELTYDPKLKGNYDLYVGLRSVDMINSFGIKLFSEKDFVHITAPFAADLHHDLDFCWRRNVKMDGQKIILKSLGYRAYIDHFKFVPLLSKEVKITGKSMTVCMDDSKHFAFPGIAQAKNGDLLAVWREGISHADPGDCGTIALIRSKDNGKTWGKRVIVYQKEKIDARDPSILCLSDGTLVITCTTKYGASIMRSYDNGYTWDEPNRTPVWSNSNGLCEAPDGRLFYAGIGSKWNADCLDIGYSTDHGKTWKYHSTVTKYITEGVFFDEPGLTILPDGRWIVMARVDVAPTDLGYLRQFTSVDNGKTWSGPVTTPMWGLPPHLLQLKDGSLLCAYGYRRKPYGIRACLSYDKGQTWDIKNELILRADGVSMDLGYPESIQLDDGDIFTLYYMNVKGSNCFIAGTFYKLKNDVPDSQL